MTKCFWKTHHIFALVVCLSVCVFFLYIIAFIWICNFLLIFVLNNLRLKRALNFEFIQCNLLEHVSPITIIIIALFYLLVLAVVVISFILIEFGTYFNIEFEIKCLCYIYFSDNLIWHHLFLSKSFSNYCWRQKLIVLKQSMFLK